MPPQSCIATPSLRGLAVVFWWCSLPHCPLKTNYINNQKHVQWNLFSHVPRPSPPPVFALAVWERRPGQSYHDLRHRLTLICITILGRRPILHSELATKTRQVPTGNNINRTKHIWARRNSSEELPNVMCETSAVTQLASVEKKCRDGMPKN